MSQPYDTWFLRLESGAAPFPAHETLPFLLAHANRLGVAVIGAINGVEVVALPGSTIDGLTRDYARAWASSLTAQIKRDEEAAK